MLRFIYIFLYSTTLISGLTVITSINAAEVLDPNKIVLAFFLNDSVIFGLLGKLYIVNDFDGELIWFCFFKEVSDG